MDSRFIRLGDKNGLRINIAQILYYKPTKEGTPEIQFEMENGEIIKHSFKSRDELNDAIIALDYLCPTFSIEEAINDKRNQDY